MGVLRRFRIARAVVALALAFVGCGSENAAEGASGSAGQAGSVAADASDSSVGGSGGSGGAVADAGNDSKAPADASGGDAEADSGADATPNLPPVPLLSYEIELNNWVEVNDGDTVLRPLDADINWNACASYDPDGTVTEIWLKTASTKQLLGPGVTCQEYTQTDHTAKDLSGYLLVKDDKGAQKKLTFSYKTQ